METGKVKWYNDIKGYGFIQMEDGKEVFVHRSGLENPHQGLNENDNVEFEVKQGEKGLMAINVKSIE
jgi:cold shock protein